MFLHVDASLGVCFRSPRCRENQGFDIRPIDVWSVHQGQPAVADRCPVFVNFRRQFPPPEESKRHITGAGDGDI